MSNCHQLKLKSSDGKYYNTDVCDIEGMFRIIQSIPSKNAEPIKEWLSKLGKERIDEIFDPSITAQRAIDLYRAKGYDEKWISKRIKGIQDRKQLTDVWKENGITEAVEYAILTNEIYKEWSGMTAKEYKQYKGLRKESLRDNMTDIEVARKGGKIAGNARRDLENEIGESVITDNNALTYEYVDKKEIEMK